MTNVVGKNIFSITMWNIVNQLGEQDFSLRIGGKKRKGYETFFSDQMNRIH